MSNIIATTDFKNEFAYADDNDGLKTKKLCNLIKKYEPKFLLHALGKGVKTLLLAGITAEEERWEQLRDGVDYEVDGEQREFGGIKELIIPYVYFHYNRGEASTSTMTGERKQDAANANPASFDRIIGLWNEMSEKMNGLWDFLYDRVDDNGDKVYPEFDTQYIDIKHFGAVNSFNI